jgi:uncharacterized protein YciI
MPLFAVHAIDRPNALPDRLEHYPAHRAYIESEANGALEIILSGPLQSDDGEVMTGSLFIIEAPERGVVERFVSADPFATNKIWGEIRISRFLRRKG